MYIIYVFIKTYFYLIYIYFNYINLKRYQYVRLYILYYGIKINLHHKI